MVAGARVGRGPCSSADRGLIAGAAARWRRAGPGSLSEYQVKAAYLYYFTTYVDWPPDTFSRSGDALVVGVLGEDPSAPFSTTLSAASPSAADGWSSRGSAI